MIWRRSGKLIHHLHSIGIIFNYRLIPDKWRAGVGYEFCYIGPGGSILHEYETNDESYDCLYKMGNYFESESEARSALASIRSLLDQFHLKKALSKLDDK